MIRIYVGLVLALMFAAGGWWLHHTGFKAGHAACEAAHEAEQVKAERQHADDLQAAADVQARITHTGDLQVADSIEASHETVRYIIRTVREHPSAGCVAPDDSVQRLRAAVREANAAASGLRRPSAGDTSTADP